mmetsp:Transcript_34674/g.83898  ORF Transcript_34674/g.83898 Transcript_34674/m.83898 type:complete len:240 (-) Transcript_34674:285-1004(-)
MELLAEAASALPYVQHRTPTRNPAPKVSSVYHRRSYRNMRTQQRVPLTGLAQNLIRKPVQNLAQQRSFKFRLIQSRNPDNLVKARRRIAADLSDSASIPAAQRIHPAHCFLDNSMPADRSESRWHDDVRFFVTKPSDGKVHSFPRRDFTFQSPPGTPPPRIFSRQYRAPTLEGGGLDVLLPHQKLRTNMSRDDDKHSSIPFPTTQSQIPQCRICGKRFRHGSGLKAHIERIHSGKKESV